MSETGVEKKRLTRQGSRGLVNPLFDVLVIVAILGILAAIAIPNLHTTDLTRTPAHRAASDTKWAVTHAIVYANDKGVYPTSLKVMRDEGYANVTDTDLWGNEWVLSPVFTEGRTPREGDNIYVFSRGRKGTGVYPQPFTHDTGEDGAIGYSSVDGCFGAAVLLVRSFWERLCRRRE
ncbi:MAG: type II secretion system protein [Candidatus Methylomirabilales bacterium]